MREQQYVGIDLHRRRSVIVRMNDAGEVLDVSKIDNDPVALSMAVAEAGPDPEVVLEACYGWYWAADLLQAEGARVHLVHPLGLHWDTRRVKNDVKDATELANRLRRNDVPEAWIAPPEVRELRELVRYRAKLTALRTSAKAQVARGDGQAGLDHRALGGGRIGGPLPRRGGDRPHLPSHRRAARRQGRQQDRQGRRGEEIAHPGLPTGCATARSAACAGRPLEQARTQPGRELEERRGPHPGGVAVDLNEPVLTVAGTHHANHREGMAGRRASRSPSSTR